MANLFICLSIHFATSDQLAGKWAAIISNWSVIVIDIWLFTRQYNSALKFSQRLLRKHL